MKKQNKNLDMSMDLIASRIRTEHNRQQHVTANVSTTQSNADMDFILADAFSVLDSTDQISTHQSI